MHERVYNKYDARARCAGGGEGEGGRELELSFMLNNFGSK